MSRAAKSPLDPDLLERLLEVMDPEVSLSVVDLGLVYRATRDESGIDIALTLTTPTCPLGEMIVEDAHGRLASRFQDAPHIGIELVWHPLWTPDLITNRGRELLGRQPKEAA